MLKLLIFTLEKESWTQKMRNITQPYLFRNDFYENIFQKKFHTVSTTHNNFPAEATKLTFGKLSFEPRKASKLSSSSPLCI